MTNNGEGVRDLANSIYENEVMYSESSLSAPIYDKSETWTELSAMMTSIMLIIIMFIFLLSFILYNSLMKSVRSSIFNINIGYRR